MKVHILYDFVPGPYGGVNQFLKALKGYFIVKGCWSYSAEAADVILFNSFTSPLQAVKLKRQFPDKVFVHRIDGPARLYNTQDDVRDRIVSYLNRSVADANIFQSIWSQKANYANGLERLNYETVIMNAPDPNLFFPADRAHKTFQSRKFKLIAASWSSNVKKGFDVYKWIDLNIDFSKYEMMFIGNSPVAFRNIKLVSPLNSASLAELLRAQDVFVAASRNDPCSNALIEALHCGLPSLAFDSGGHPEIMGRGGVLFSRSEDIPGALEQLKVGYKMYRGLINLPSLEVVGQSYLNFMESIYQMTKSGKMRAKRLGPIQYVELLAHIGAIAIASFVRSWRISHKKEEYVNLGIKDS